MAGAAGNAIVSRSDALKETPRVAIDGKHIEGSIALKGARFDDVRLNDYFQDTSNTEKVALLSPANTQFGYYVDNGWLASGNGVQLPGKDTVWASCLYADAIMHRLDAHHDRYHHVLYRYANSDHRIGLMPYEPVARGNDRATEITREHVWPLLLAFLAGV